MIFSREDIPALFRAQRVHRYSGKCHAKAVRIERLNRLERMLNDNRTAILAALAADMRKPPQEAYGAEIAMVLAEIKYARRRVGSWMRPRKVRTVRLNRPGHSRILPRPFGTVLIIGPWNYPIGLLLMPLVSALAAGNSVVLKPSEYAPSSAALMAALCADTFDPLEVACITGGKECAQAAIAAKPDLVFFTGGNAAGRAVMQACAQHLIPVVLELGGCNPCIVDSHTSIERAATRVAWGKFFNAGQTCLAPNTCYVARRVHREFLVALCEAVERFYGPDPRRCPDYARIVNRDHCARLSRLLAPPATIHIGGQVDCQQCYVAPTVLQPHGDAAALTDQEIFGPLLPVVPYERLDEVLAELRKRPPPLAVYLFSQDRAVWNRVREQTISGSICINGTLHIAVAVELPFGGVGESGMGRYHGRAGFEACSYSRAELIKSERWEWPLLYPPYRRGPAGMARMLPWMGL